MTAIAAATVMVRRCSGAPGMCQRNATVPASISAEARFGGDGQPAVAGEAGAEQDEADRQHRQRVANVDLEQQGLPSGPPAVVGVAA